MDWIIFTTVSLLVSKAAICFNLDPVAWKSLSNPAAGFGYQVVQRRADLLVSAPLEQHTPSARGRIYRCSTATCTPLTINVPAFAVNMSLGLAMAADPDTQNTLACGPTIPKDCKSITLYNGVCVKIDGSNRVGSVVPSTPPECRTQADIAFLLDGSGSVSAEDFDRMKTFVKNLVRGFLGKDTKFSISQFSTNPTVHYNFNTFNDNRWESQINGIQQLTGWTYTAKAMEHVVNNVFSSSKGSRPNVKKVLIVITDGQSNDRRYLGGSANLAERKKIVRFAIGVGNAFTTSAAKEELDTIASRPPANYVFRVDNFGALDIIRQNLQDKIFSIEGSQATGETLKMEMAQEGFSAAFAPGQGFQMAAVGANQWRGNFQQYLTSGQTMSPFSPSSMDPDSYLGYSMAVAKTRFGPLTVVGAPRYQHRGIAMAVYENSLEQTIDPFQFETKFQIGRYFGAVVCAMDVDRDTNADLILISAPMSVEDDREGRVYVCRINILRVECQFDNPNILKGDPSERARFGSSLAVLPDLNNDGLNDLAVGAPLENDGQGSIYIFQSETKRRINPFYSQRVAASEVKSGLKFFGMSIGQSANDMSDDGLPDLAVGSKGTVVLLRSRPIVLMEITVAFNPNRIPTQNQECKTPLVNTAKICFTMTPQSKVQQAEANVNYTFTLDATRKVPNNRAYFTENEREKSASIHLSLNRQLCVDVPFNIEPCPDDIRNSLYNELRFSFMGLPSSDKLSPSLSQLAQMSTTHPLDFEINCGSDNECTDYLVLDFNFTTSTEVKVGIDDLLSVTVSLKNLEENAYNARVVLTYPSELSFRKFTGQEGRIECDSLDSLQGRGKTECSVNKPVLRSNSEAIFIVHYGIDSNSIFDRSIYITANATSGNQAHSPSSQLYKTERIDVKYSIFVTIDSTLSYTNFTHGRNDLEKRFQQSIAVTNDIRGFNFSVLIRVPVKLGEKDIWANLSSLEIPDCQKYMEEKPNITDFVARIKENKIVDCSVAHCMVFKCTRFMGRLERKEYKISSNISSGWIEQIGLDTAKYLLISTAAIEYDTNQYVFFSVATNNKAPIRKVEAEVEVYPEPDFTKEIVGGSLGGLALLALITAGLYKAGFFKSKYQNMMNEDAGAENAGEGAPGEGGADPQE